MWLVELGSFEAATLNLNVNTGYITWYIFETGSRGRLMVLNLGKKVHSLESFFRNGRWLEREAGEMVGVVFIGKRDRRGLFGLPVFYLNPLRKAFPTGGVFDLGLCPLTCKLVFRHVSWLS
jgi:Ni,Fe-hydrogenase III component G